MQTKNNPSMISLVPNVLEKTSDGERVFDIFSHALTYRVIRLTGTVDDNMADLVGAQLEYLEDQDPTQPIKVYISSGGGSVYAGMAILNFMRKCKCDIMTVVTSHAMSMASFLAACGGTKGKRFMMPNTTHMIHQPLSGSQGQQIDMKIQSDNMVEMRNMLESLYAEATGQDQEFIHQSCDRDNYLTVEQSLAIGLADAILTEEVWSEIIQKSADGEEWSYDNPYWAKQAYTPRPVFPEIKIGKPE